MPLLYVLITTKLIVYNREKGTDIMKARRCVLMVGMFILMTMAAFAGTTGAEAKTKQTALSKAKVTLSKTSYTYNGKAKKPAVTVKVGKKKLKKNKDYTVKYSKNKNAGTAKVTVKAKKKKTAKYKGSISKTFKIKKASRKVVPDRTAYTAVEGDGAFNITAKASKGTGTITYSCSTKDVISVTSAGKVTVVKKFDRNCKKLSSLTKDTIKKATAKVKVSLKATTNYKAASATVSVTINKKPSRTVDSAASIRDYAYKIKGGYDKSLVKNLTDLDWSLVDKYQVPGLAPTADDDWIKEYVQCNNLCPQGICMAGDYMLTTAYCMDSIHNSCIFIYNNNTGEFLRTLVLSDQKTHVGGITYDPDNKFVWICHSKKDANGMYSLQRITYSELQKYADGSKSCVLSSTASLQKIPTKPSTISYCKKDGYLWVAQFHNPSDDTEDSDEEDTGNNAANEPKMYAYEYKNGKLLQVRQLNNTAIEDYLGVHTVDEEMEVVEGMEKVVVVDTVYRTEGTLSKEKLKKGDILYAINGNRIESSEKLEEILAACGENDVLTFDIRRPVADEEEIVSGSAVQVVKMQELTDKLIIGSRGQIVYRNIPDYVQGVTFTESGKTIFSCSYGRKGKISQVEIYGATDEDNPSGMGELEMAIAVPPMIEEVEMVGDELYMIFESAATKYLEGTDGKGEGVCPIDKIVAVKLKLD